MKNNYLAEAGRAVFNPAPLLIAALVLTLLLGVVTLSSCAAEDRAAAQRANAEAALEAAKGERYARQVQADAAAASERASTRQMERDAAHERALEMLPYVLIVSGMVLIGGVAAWILALRVTGQGSAESQALLAYIERLQLAQADRDRELWRAIAEIERRALGPGDREVVVYRGGDRDRTG